VVKQTQLNKLVSERNQGRTITMSAMKAGMRGFRSGRGVGGDVREVGRW
jgi:hypothetical protein